MSINIDMLEDIEGFIGGCVVDKQSGMIMAQKGSGLDLEIAGAVNAEVVRAKERAINELNLNDDIEDILITLGQQYHLIRPLSKESSIFLYLALNKDVANLALSRFKLRKLAETMTV